jgi:hypothetical protein
MARDQGKLKIGVKYCGGCNPNYDRVALVKQIEERLKEKASLVKADDEGTALVLAVAGCSTACADLTPFAGMEVRIITCPADAEIFIRDLKTRA